MNCAQSKQPRAFTLLEVVIAVAIIAMVGITIFRFLESSLRAIAFSSQQSNDTAAMEGLIAVVQAQLNDLPAGEPGVLLGDAHQFNNNESDEMQWLCGAGNGLFTQFASGKYRVTLALQPVPKTTTSELGLRRVVADGTDSDLHWLHLLGEVDALEFRYYDQRLNAWLEKWTDQASRPSLVRMRLWRAGAEQPVEIVLTLPVARLPT